MITSRRHWRALCSFCTQRVRAGAFGLPRTAHAAPCHAVPATPEHRAQLYTCPPPLGWHERFDKSTSAGWSNQGPLLQASMRPRRLCCGRLRCAAQTGIPRRRRTAIERLQLWPPPRTATARTTQQSIHSRGRRSARAAPPAAARQPARPEPRQMRRPFGWQTLSGAALPQAMPHTQPQLRELAH